MYQEQFNLSPKDILEKEFKIDTRGYRLKEVDGYLDLIIGDYEQFYNILREKDKEIDKLQEEILSLKSEIRNLKLSIEIAESEEKKEDASRNVSNVDVLRRLSQLEKIVYGKEE